MRRHLRLTIGQFIASRRGGDAPEPDGVTTLAALALGHVTDFTPPVARAALAGKIAELYLSGL